MEIGESKYFACRKEWRRWLAKNHKKKKEIWLIYLKKSSDKPTISYNDSVEESICFGWIDSQLKPIDQEKFARRFTPRMNKNKWAKSNKIWALKMCASGKMTKAGLEVLPIEVIKEIQKSIILFQ